MPCRPRKLCGGRSRNASRARNDERRPLQQGSIPRQPLQQGSTPRSLQLTELTHNVQQDHAADEAQAHDEDGGRATVSEQTK